MNLFADDIITRVRSIYYLRVKKSIVFGYGGFFQVETLALQLIEKSLKIAEILIYNASNSLRML